MSTKDQESSHQTRFLTSNLIQQDGWSQYQLMVLTTLERLEKDLKALEAKGNADVTSLKADLNELRQLVLQEIQSLKARNELDYLRASLETEIKARVTAEKKKDSAFEDGVKHGQLAEKVDSGYALRKLFSGSIFSFGVALTLLLLKLLFGLIGVGF